MTKDELNNEYFEWMYQLVCNDNDHRRNSYRKLLYFLHDVEFTYIIAMDANRQSDGEDLRYRFGYEYGYDQAMIATYLDDRPCSVLEMMIALSLRCEEQIMSDPDIGNRTSEWFWGMIESLGLYFMTDEHFSLPAAEHVISRFLNRDYKRNGEDGLFTVNNPIRDMRTTEIWYQMCLYLNEYLDD